MTLYRNIFSQAMKITWRYKYLWFFGLFAALLGNGGELELILRRFDGTVEQGLFPGLQSLLSTGLFSRNTLFNIKGLAARDPLSLFFLLSVILLVLALAAFLIWMIIVSQAALVNNTAKIKLGKRHTFKEGLSLGIKKFIPVFSLNALLKIIIYTVFVLLSLPVIASLNSASFNATSLMFVISFIVFIPIAIVLSFIIKYAVAYTVIKDENCLLAIKSGWQLFLKNWLISLEMAFLLFVINFLVGLALILGLLVLAVPFVFLVIALSKLALVVNLWLFIVVAVALYIVVLVFVGSMLATFQIASWTSLFLELVSRGGTSKLTRLFNRE